MTREKVQLFERPGRRPHPGDRSGSARPVDRGDETAKAKATADYRRRARRLRQQFAADPTLLQHHLSALSRRHDLSRPPAPQSPRPAVRRAAPSSTEQQMARAVVDWFTDHVASTLEGRLLTGSSRHDLLKTAHRLGIPRFHANLVIAVLQHDAAQTPGPVERIAATRRSTFSIAALLLLVQLLIAGAAWYAFTIA